MSKRLFSMIVILCKVLRLGSLAPPLETTPCPIFSRTKAAWQEHACPAEINTYSCYWQNQSRAAEVENIVEHGDFAALRFLHLVQGRTLVFVGDSVLLQFWQSVVCRLNKEGFKYQIGWYSHRKFQCPWGPQHCHIEYACAYHPMICYVKDFYLELSPELFRYFDLGADDVVVLNFGLHAHDPSDLKMKLDVFSQKLQLLQPKPVVFWAETPPQHFPGNGSGYYTDEMRRHYHRCAPLDMDVARTLDWRNRVAETVMGKIVPIIPLWDVSAIHWNAHVIHSNIRALSRVDCTHYCLPGVPFHWAKALLQTMETHLLQPPANGVKPRDVLRKLPFATCMLWKNPRKPPKKRPKYNSQQCNPAPDTLTTVNSRHVKHCTNSSNG